MDRELELRTLAAEDDHWWYRGRRSIVLEAVARRLAASRSARSLILDAGCGGGAVLAGLAELGETVGVEPSPLSRSHALARGAGEVVDARLEQLPFADGEFSLATCLDVLEHTDDDRACLRELARVVAPGGALVVTVPAHPRLWSRHDELNHHRRRYTRSSLVAAASASGWTVERISHFNTLLLPVAALARPLDRGDGLGIPAAPINRALQAALDLERLAIRAGISFGVGLSLLAELSR